MNKSQVLFRVANNNEQKVLAGYITTNTPCQKQINAFYKLIEEQYLIGTMLYHKLVTLLPSQSQALFNTHFSFRS